MSFFLLLLSGLLSFPAEAAVRFGINYGMVANDLPSPAWVAGFIQSLGVSRVKLYDADPTVLSAFGETDVEFIISVANEDVSSITGAEHAEAWLQKNVQPFLPQTRITCITVGNEVLTGNDTTLMSNLLPAMQAMYQALVNLGLEDQVNVSTAHSFFILGESYPPSAGAFKQNLLQYIQPILNFHAEINSPFLINAYPFFAYEEDPSSVSLSYVLFEPNPGVTDSNNKLVYDNMLYAQIDAVFAAAAALGFSGVTVKISETGWPSKGDADEPGASPENAALYNGNLMQRVAMGQGTPLKPAVPVDVYVFALFNEDLKPGPASERNYGLFYPDGSPVYNIGLQTSTTSSSSSSSSHTTSEIKGMPPARIPLCLLLLFLLYAV